MGPRIGITCDLDDARTTNTLPRAYVRAVLRAGGLPLALPIPEMEHTPGGLAPENRRWESWLSGLDGLLLSGGGDLAPSLFGEEPLPGLGSVDPHRDALEMALVRAARKRRMPVLGICRGCQVLNVALGGTVYQDLPSQRPEGLLQHRQLSPGIFPSHSMAVREGSRLAKALGVTAIRVNSHHHQAVRDVAPGFEVVAWAPDGVVEAIEAPEGPFLLGIQSHPERLESTTPPLAALFQAFVEAAGTRYFGAAVVRPAGPHDALDLARIQVDGWRSSYRGLVEDAFLDAMNYAEASDRFLARLQEPGHEILVVEHGGRVAGFAGFGPSRTAPEEITSPGEIYALYVHPARQGRGFGSALLEASLTRLRERGLFPAHLWTLRENAPALAFYADRGGFAGDLRFLALGNQTLEEVRFDWGP